MAFDHPCARIAAPPSRWCRTSCGSAMAWCAAAPAPRCSTAGPVWCSPRTFPGGRPRCRSPCRPRLRPGRRAGPCGSSLGSARDSDCPASEPVPPWEDEPAFSQSPARPWAQPPSTTPPAVLRSREQIRRQAQDQDARADELDDDELLDDELHDDESQDDEPRGGRRHGEDGHDDASGWRDRADERYPHSRPAAPRFEERRGEAFVADDRRGEPSLSWSAPVRAEAVREPALRARVRTTAPSTTAAAMPMKMPLT